MSPLFPIWTIGKSSQLHSVGGRRVDGWMQAEASFEIILIFNDGDGDDEIDICCTYTSVSSHRCPKPTSLEGRTLHLDRTQEHRALLHLGRNSM